MLLLLGLLLLLLVLLPECHLGTEALRVGLACGLPSDLLSLLLLLLLLLLPQEMWPRRRMSTHCTDRASQR